jgi:hypothetical protein|tara:strand:+ start:1937 stop:2716 length:780 start_codon:yes stop_codon:yes gene_type:complete
MAVIRPPITGDPQLDSWTDQLTRQINQGILPGIGGSGGSGLQGPSGITGNTPLYLYQRSESGTIAPTRPTSVTYNFSILPLTPTSIVANNGWSYILPAATDVLKYLWVTFRYISTTSGSFGASDQNTWDTPVLIGQPGDGGISATIESSNGTVFRNSAGNPTTLKVVLNIGGVLPSESEYNSYSYKWTYGNQTVCVDTNRNLLNLNGVPMVSTDGTTCSVGVPADSSVTTSTSGSLREIIVGSEDITSSAKLKIEVGNI